MISERAEFVAEQLGDQIGKRRPCEAALFIGLLFAVMYDAAPENTKDKIDQLISGEWKWAR